MPRVTKDPAARPAVARGIPPQILDILTEVLSIDEDMITLDAKLVEDLGADSLDVIEASMAFEEEFGIAIDDAVAERWETGTVQDVLTDLRRRGVKV